MSKRHQRKHKNEDFRIKLLVDFNISFGIQIIFIVISGNFQGEETPYDVYLHNAYKNIQVQCAYECDLT